MRSAIVGCGNVAQVHAKAIVGMEKAELVAVADICAEKAEKMAEEYGNGTYYVSGRTRLLLCIKRVCNGCPTID